jgi:hypothetical protein
MIKRFYVVIYILIILLFMMSIFSVSQQLERRFRCREFYLDFEQLLVSLMLTHAVVMILYVLRILINFTKREI